jgi:16S rRNA (guanine527-N7)-methyltransferase
MSRKEARAAGAASDPDMGLAELAAQHGLALDPARRLALDAFTTLLLAWNARINLTGARTRAALVSGHFPDAFALAALLDGPAHVVDVGSGGGLPALPLAILRPELAVDLCESIAKKGAFLRTAIRELGLGGRVQLHAVRAEALLSTHAARFDVAMSRATLPPVEWLALGERLVRPGGRVLALVRSGGPTAPADRRHPYDAGRRAILERDVPRETSQPG